MDPPRHTHLTIRQLAPPLDRTEEATSHSQHLHPGHGTTRNRLHAAGMNCAQIGLQDDSDPQFLDALLQELANT